jgi:hypothetical protein
MFLDALHREVEPTFENEARLIFVLMKPPLVHIHWHTQYRIEVFPILQSENL